MLDIKYIFGESDSLFELNPALITGDVFADAENADIKALTAGKLITVDSNGYVVPCDGASQVCLGVVINDAAGYPLENKPAIASGKVPALSGGSVCITDAVADTTVTAGAKLYCGTGANVGLLTVTDPTGSSDGQVVAIARTSNSAADKSVLVTYKV